MLPNENKPKAKSSDEIAGEIFAFLGYFIVFLGYLAVFGAIGIWVFRTIASVFQ